ncbi:MAG TPA: glycosyltransferase family 4 protein [Candidatus Polarisedimenticolaceae bacterium]|nr:glycosyltransferase family 4 protein [Candidatus Polarisedimenticolaceae bacterium]
MSALSGPVRVMHVCDKFGIRGSRVHGVSRLLAWWFPRFDRRQVEPMLVHLRGDDAAARNLRASGVSAVSLGKGKFNPTTWTALRRAAQRFRPHVIHVHGYGGANFCRPLARLLGSKLVLHEHAAYPHVPPYQVPLDLAMAGMTDAGIAVSRTTKDFMVRRRFLPASKIRVVFNGAPLDEFKPESGERAAAARARYGIPETAPLLGTVGRLDAQKGNTHLLAALPAVLARHPDVHLLIVGEGELMDEHRAQAYSLGLSHRVVFAGFSSEIPLLQSAMDVQVFPSIFEGTPLTLFEAMSMARPIVSTWVDGLGEVLRHEESGLLVPPADPAALAEALCRLLDDPALSARLAARAQADSRRYDIRSTVEALEEIYRGLVDRLPEAA